VIVLDAPLLNFELPVLMALPVLAELIVPPVGLEPPDRLAPPVGPATPPIRFLRETGRLARTRWAK